MKKSHRITIQAAGFAVRAICHSILATTTHSDQRAEHAQIVRNQLSLMSDFIDSAVNAGDDEHNGRII